MRRLVAAGVVAVTVAMFVVVVALSRRDVVSRLEMRNLEAVVYIQGRQIERQRGVIVALADLQRTQSETVGTIISSQRSELSIVSTLAQGQGYTLPRASPPTVQVVVRRLVRASPRRRLALGGGDRSPVRSAP